MYSTRLIIFVTAHLLFAELQGSHMQVEGQLSELFTREQEAVIVGMVLQDNVIRLREIQERVIQDNTHF